MLTIDVRFSEAGTGRGVGRWRTYSEAEDETEALWRCRNLVPKAQVRIRDGRETLIGPCLVEELPSRGH
jgi:hypothetical protein